MTTVPMTEVQARALEQIQQIMDALSESVNASTQLPPSAYLEGAMKLNALRYALREREAQLHRRIAHEKSKSYVVLENMSAAKAAVEAMSVYEEWMKIRARADQVEEHIRIAKKVAERADMELRNSP